MNEQKCCTRQSLRRMVCSVLPVQVSRARAPTPNTSLTGSSKRKARVLHKHPNLDFSMRIPKWVSAELETAVLNLSRGPDSDYRLEPTQAAGQHPRIRTPDGQHCRTGTCRSRGIITRPGLDGPTRSERCFSKQVATDTLRAIPCPTAGSTLFIQSTISQRCMLSLGSGRAAAYAPDEH